MIRDHFDRDPATGRAMLPPAETEQVDYDHRTARWVWGLVGLGVALFWGWML